MKKEWMPKRSLVVSSGNTIIFLQTIRYNSGYFIAKFLYSIVIEQKKKLSPFS